MAEVTKKAKAEVDYSRSKGEDRCSVCVNFISPDECRKVRGEIDPDYWCELFKRRRIGG